MMMGKPITRPVVYLYIAHPNSIANLYLCIEKVGAGIVVMKTGIDNLDTFTIGGSELSKWKEFVLPHIMKQLFHG